MGAAKEGRQPLLREAAAGQDAVNCSAQKSTAALPPENRQLLPANAQQLPKKFRCGLSSTFTVVKIQSRHGFFSRSISRFSIRYSVRP